MLNAEQEKQLADYLLASFATSGELHGWLCTTIWPRFKTLAGERNKASAAAYRAELKAQKPQRDVSMSAYETLDGTPIPADGRDGIMSYVRSGELVRRTTDFPAYHIVAGQVVRLCPGTTRDSFYPQIVDGPT